MTSITFPAAALGWRLPNLWDLAAIVAVFGILVGIAHVAGGTLLKLTAPQAVAVSLDPSYLPDYAVRTRDRPEPGGSIGPSAR